MSILNSFRQRGLSMVELLVALAISSFLVLGITQIYIDNKRNYIFQQSQAGNLENSRFAVLMIDELLSKAGYRRVPDPFDIEMGHAFPASSGLSTHCEAFLKGNVVTKIKATSSGQVGFCLRYQPASNGELICDGNSATLTKDEPFQYPAQNETVYVAIKFTPHATDLNKGTLSCITKDTSAELIDGVADMSVKFGSGTSSEKRLNTASPFKEAENWTSGDGTVRAVRYSLLVASRNNQRDSDSNIYTQWLSTASTAAKARLVAQDKKQIYQVVAGAQAIRNVMP